MLCENEPVGSVPDHVIILLLSSLGDYLVASGSVADPDGGACQTPDPTRDPARSTVVGFSMAAEAELLRFQMLPGTSSMV
jgi:hypothetical protein